MTREENHADYRAYLSGGRAAVERLRASRLSPPTCEWATYPDLVAEVAVICRAPATRLITSGCGGEHVFTNPTCDAHAELLPDVGGQLFAVICAHCRQRGKYGVRVFVVANEPIGVAS